MAAEDEENSEEGAAQPKRRRKNRGRVYVAPERCKGCGYCVEFCAPKVLALSAGFNQKGYHPPEVVDLEACTGCDLCGMYCPDFAIFAVRIREAREEVKEVEEHDCVS